MGKVLTSLVVALLSCQSSADGSSDPGSSGPPCALTLSGGTSGSFACTLRSATWSDATDTGTVMVGYGGAGQQTPSIGATFTFPVPPRAGIFTQTDADAGTTGQITVTLGSASWAATADASAPAEGAFTLNLTKVLPTKLLADGEIYAFSGTLDATLPPLPQTSATGDVTLHATF